MEDPRIDAAWKSYQRFMDGMPPHELPQHLRSLLVPDEVIDALIARHEKESARIVALKEPLGIGRENALNWYTGPRKGDRNWPAFESRLRRSMSGTAVDKIHDSSDKVVAMLDHPGTPTFNSRGLVVGHVQSGKTSNFTAVAAKAADRGYRIFIVFSGVHNSLRRQTQIRLLRDLVELNPPAWHQITNPDHDFRPPSNAPSFFASTGQHVLLVVKKNASVLHKLKVWLATAREQLENCPTLVIDDEADQATVATKKINPLIRGVLDQLPKVCYVGYTATPFGNLLIDPADDRDFYPRDFVISLPQGEGYQGSETLFGRPPLDTEDPADAPTGTNMIRVVPDEELDGLRPAKKADLAGFQPEITKSLRHAVLWFWLATAARHARGQQGQHSSMLIHAHSNTAVHDSYEMPLRNFLAETERAAAEEETSLLRELETLWTEEQLKVPPSNFGKEPLPFASLRPYMMDVISSTTIVRDHYRSTDRLDYDSGTNNVIAVGGNTLSRGLTLEGLVVSVFVRSTDMYDTLLQMGRWFGYRNGYEDLPRIWMPAELRRWFSHLASVEADMRREIERYLVEHKTPLELAVRIRCHPKMRVTAPNRMARAVRAAASYGGQLLETRYFPCAPHGAPVDRFGTWDKVIDWHRTNERTVQALLVKAASQGKQDSDISSSGAALYRNVPTSYVQDFTRHYKFDETSTEYSTDLVLEYVQKRMQSGGLQRWNVGVVGKSGAGRPVRLPDGRELVAVSRARTQNSIGEPVADIKTLTGSRDPGLDLKVPPSGSEENDEETSRAGLNRLRRLQQPEVGLLLLYPIDGRSTSARGDRGPLDAPEGIDIVWGAALLFPQPVSGNDIAVEYDYVQADLSRVFPASAEGEDDEDLSILDTDLDRPVEDTDR